MVEALEPPKTSCGSAQDSGASVFGFSDPFAIRICWEYFGDTLQLPKYVVGFFSWL